MQLNATEFYPYRRPSVCTLRVHLNAVGAEAEPPSEYEMVLRKLGEQHEQNHLHSFPEIVDLSSETFEERESRTKEEVGKETPVIYQAVLRAEVVLNDTRCEIVGQPDFLIRDGSGYAIRDCKISRRITEKDHPEILRQLETYGWLYEQVFGAPPTCLEVFSGTSDIEPVNYDGGAAALAELAEILGYMLSDTEPFSPVGWTKCGACGYHPRCWKAAEERRDVALVAAVDQGLVTGLRGEGVTSYDALLEQYDENALAEFRRPWGKGLQKVGKKASGVLRMARAMATGQETVLQTPEIPEFPNYVMFDLEGLPPHLDETEKIYLWGMQVFGDKPSEFMPALAGFGEQGDQEGWNDFLQKADSVFAEYGDIPFVHWHHYEKTKLNLYIDRYGDRQEVAGRVKQNLLDLLPVTQKSVALPLPSYSLKVVEKYIGFKRTQKEFGGDWSMAMYIEATETANEKLRNQVMDEILVYNREDLEATWAVLQWLKSKEA